MHIVIVGAGRIGLSLARLLVAAGHEIAVVEKDDYRCSALDEILGSVSVMGDCTDARVLAKAGANRAEVLIATSGKDDVNLVACQLAKHHFGVPRTISIVNTRDHTELFDILGIDVAVDETELLVGRIQAGLSAEGPVRLLTVSESEGASLVAIKIPRRYGRAGRALKDMSLPPGTFVSLIITRDGEVSIPDGNALIRAGDQVIAVTTTQREEELRDLLIKGSEE